MKRDDKYFGVKVRSTAYYAIQILERLAADVEDNYTEDFSLDFKQGFAEGMYRALKLADVSEMNAEEEHTIQLLLEDIAYNVERHGKHNG